MVLSTTAIAEAIKAELVRDQRELQEIQKRLLELEERARVNRAWLRTYGFLDAAEMRHGTPVVEFELNELNSDHSPPPAEPVEIASSLESVDQSQSEIAVEPPATTLKGEGRRELYEALISRGARIGS